MDLSSAISPRQQGKASVSLGRLTPKHLVLTAGTIFITLLLAVSGVTITLQRQQAIEEWRGNLVNLSRLLAEHARQSIKAADLVQKSIADRVTELGVADDAALRRVLGSRATFDMLNDKVSGVPQLDVATIVAANGDVINFSRSYPPPPITLVDRDYFQEHLADRDLKLFLSMPAKSRGSGRWTFYLTRKIKNPQGDTIGLTLAGIDSAFFSEYYKAVNFSEYGAISLYRTDGALLARMPEREEAMGKILGDQPGLKALREGKETIITNEARLVDSSDTRFRIVAVRAVPDYPLAVVVTATEEVVLSAWRQKALFIGGGALVMAAVFVGLLFWIVRLLDNRERTMARLRHSEEDQARKATALAQKNQDLEQFTEVLAHHLQEPVRLQYVFARRLSGLLTALPEDADQALRFVMNGAMRQRALLRDVQQYLALDQHPTLPPMVPSPMDTAVDMALTRLDGKILAASATIDREMLPKALIDRARLADVVTIVIDNAIDHAHPDNPPHIRINAEERGPEVILSVSDNGPGISEQYRSRVFRVFERLNPGANTEATGIGLAIAKKIVETAAGRIWIETAEGGGTRIMIALPSGASAHPSAEGR